MLNGAEELRRRHNNLKVYINQLPPRKKFKNKEILEVNQIVKDNCPNYIHIIKQNLTAKHLHDEKHIHWEHIGKYVQNIKSKVRQVVRLDEKSPPRPARPTPAPRPAVTDIQEHCEPQRNETQQVGTNSGNEHSINMWLRDPAH